MTWTEWGSAPSWLLNSMTTFQFRGTVNVSPPSLKPLKFSPLFRLVSPAVSRNVAVLVALSTVSQVQSICADCFVGAGGFCAIARTESTPNPTIKQNDFVICPSYMAVTMLGHLPTASNRETEICVEAGRRFVEPVRCRVDDH